MRTVDVVGVVGGIVGVACAAFAFVTADGRGPRVAIAIVIAILLAQLLLRLSHLSRS